MSSMIRIRIQPTTKRKEVSRQKGVSLIESLVALFILGLGILGLAGIQTRSLTETRLTNSRAAALRMTSDIQERMKLNGGAKAIAPANPYLVGFGAAAAAPVDCNAANCTPTQLAQFDLNQWKTTLAATLPGGDGSIYAIPSDANQFGVIVSWSNNQSAAAASDQATYSAPFAINTNVGGAACPAGAICHLSRIRP